MKLPFDLLSATYTKPRLFLCEVDIEENKYIVRTFDKERICQLKTSNTKGAFKFNSLSELDFEVARIYNNDVTGETKVNP